MFISKFVMAASGLATLAQAHMKMRFPPPYTSPAIKSSPLDPSGSNFPCQAGKDTQYSGEPTLMEKGSTQSLTFTGSAVHGGGSCQISITYDDPPTKKSTWKVIHSIQGGCPARGVEDNAGDDPEALAKDEYPFSIDENLPAGKATLAMSWLNKKGNREFYMNCAPVNLTGSEGSMEALNDLPDMLVANLPGINDCTTEEKVDIEYPNPGSSVETNPGANLGPPQGNCGGGSGGGKSAGGKSAGGESAGGEPGDGAAISAPAIRGRRVPLRD
ncbi:hypothetical protein MMYC01_205582 [Madurella mycetomatis]|uniref:Lytic polysaccharide monooxygenase n=1 Tax=Madurella mycetomatis TaxID=100816 RepID=A0A175W479_9PEZI|nr:hypothetical protein MMYC01_205582 [Madurella mycetomatis]